MINLHTSVRERDASSTLAAVTPLLTRFDIEGYVDHTPPGVSTARCVEVVRGNPRSGYLNLGKGVGHAATLASGYMEAIEMATIEHPDGLDRPRRANPREAPSFFTPGDSTTVPTGSVSGTLDPQTLLVGEELLTGRNCYTRASDHLLTGEDGELAGRVTTNGLASGNSLAEARLHAVHELVERHVSFHGLRSPGLARRIGLEGASPVVAAAVAELRSVGIDCDLFLLGDMFGVRVTHCSVTFTDAGGHRAVSFGWGAHEALAVAACRALCEAVQVHAIRRAVRSGAVPPGRMRAGILVSAAHHAALSHGFPLAGSSLHARLAASAAEPLDADDWADDPVGGLTSAQRMDRLVAHVRQSPIDELLSWTVSGPDLPFVVVKCAIPGLDSFV